VIRIKTPLLAAFLYLCAVGAASALDVRAAVLRVDYPGLLPISRLDLQPDDLGFAGAQLADMDNGTTGTFLGHTYATQTHAAAPEQADAALDEILADGVRLIVIAADGADLLRLAERASQEGALVFNARAPDRNLRSEACRANLLHVAPSHAMMADAVAQFAVWKQWTDWFLVSGSNPADKALADAYRRAADKFGARIVEEREFEDTGGARRSDTGHVMVQRQLPVFTQGADRYDVLVAADATDYFAPYLSYHAWTPRPAIGSSGLRPTVMHPATRHGARRSSRPGSRKPPGAA